MQIKKEDFWKLKQLDRIEYHLAISKYKKDNSANNTIYAIYFIIGLFAFVFLCATFLTVYSGSDTAKTFLTKISIPFTIVIIVYVILCFIMDIFEIIRYLKAQESLDRKFFNLVVK